MLKECKNHGLTEYVVRTTGYTRCRKCASEAVSRRQRIVKKIVREERGGKCELCGYSKCSDALEWHHIDPKLKVFGISQGQYRSLSRLRDEVKKCVLLCANCHREVEAGVTQLGRVSCS